MIIMAFLGPKMQKYKNFKKSIYYILLKFYVMTGMLGCIIPCTWVKARLQLLIQLPWKKLIFDMIKISTSKTISCSLY